MEFCDICGKPMDALPPRQIDYSTPVADLVAALDGIPISKVNLPRYVQLFFCRECNLRKAIPVDDQKPGS